MSGRDDGIDYLIGQAGFTAPPLEAALYLVATPIGNLADITVRALETLAACDVLACEDTRVTRVLLSRYGIGRRTMAYHEHNAAEAGPRLIEAVLGGKSVALVSDAGTPLISDPGYRLVAEALEAGIRVVPIPGASAVLAALSASGLPTDAFLFAGFLPSKAEARRRRIEELSGVPATLVFYESPRRLAAALSDFAATLGERSAVIGREITKAFEEFRRGTLPDLAAHYVKADTPKGEVVVCVAPPGERAADPAETDRMLLALSAEMPASKAAAEVARLTGGTKSDLYRRLLALREGDGGR
ncbi:MAG: 16S rRNA (cytidine(1402)-2'-O)-methyltransferase [Brucellaceae bacterium]|nr:16S rRNA (cytidine(1402)-2'-O)-methyltransferase [Brucellaceae bacterium]